MFLIDTHTHLNIKVFNVDIHEVIRRAMIVGVNKFCIPNIDLTSTSRINILCNNYPNICFSMIGLHPTNINTNYKKNLAFIHNELINRQHIAIGEIGIDLYRNKKYAKKQIEAFEEQLHWSIEWNLPVVIHTREAFLQVFESLYKIGVNKLRGVFHSFNGNLETLKEILTYKNFMIGINGMITYKSIELQKYLSTAPIEKILLETDAPYLTPMPLKGKRNEPAYIIHIIQKIAKIYNLPIELVAKITTDGAKKLFNI